MRVAVIGAGPGGIAMGIQFAAAGYDFTIFDRGDGFGGTWRNNTFPGAACDVPSHFYSYSFALNPRWSKTFANQPEILAYLERVADDHQLAEQTRCADPSHHVAMARRCGALDTGDGGRHDARVRRRRHRSRHARRPLHSRRSRCRAIPGPDVSLVELGPLEIDCGRTCRIDRDGRKRDPVRTRDRRRGRAPDRVPAHADLGEPPLRRTVHRRTAGSSSNAIPTRRSRCATRRSRHTRPPTSAPTRR